jgi:hypothetical protein
VLRGVEAGRYARGSWTSDRNLVEGLPLSLRLPIKQHLGIMSRSAPDRSFPHSMVIAALTSGRVQNYYTPEVKVLPPITTGPLEHALRTWA